MKRSVFMLSAVALMELLLLAAAVMTVMVLTTAATADTAFAAGGGPAIGGLPPGTGQRNGSAELNPSTDDRTLPRTRGQSPRFTEECVRDQPARFCEPG